MMRKMVVIVAVAAFFATASAGCGGGDNEGMTRSGKGGGIDVEATWLDDAATAAIPELADFPLNELSVFEIKVKAQTVDLEKFPLGVASRLGQGGGAGVIPRFFMPTAQDAHHTEGRLVFSRVAGDGPFTLTIDVGEDAPIELTWDAQP